MKALLAWHWVIGSGLALAGALAYRMAPALLAGGTRTTWQLIGLAAVSVGLFTVARGVSRVAQARDARS